MRWHLKEIEAVLEELDTSLNGLPNEEAEKLLLKYGLNELIAKPKKSTFIMFFDQFKDFMILVLIAAAVIAGVIGEASDTFAIVFILVLNAVIGFLQEYRAEKAMELLQKMSAHSAVVLRNGKNVTLPSSDLVPGDIVTLEAGAIVAADMRLIESASLKIEEAALTGESLPVEKNPATLLDDSLPLGDRLNMAYKGTIVTAGRGRGVVVATGMSTQFGKIAGMLQNVDILNTPLQKRLARFGKKLAIAVLAICAIVFVFGLLRGEEPLLMLLTAISLAVAAIPEALPAVLTISLALGAKKLVGQNALIRKLHAVETLGSVTYICSDKTGTLTMNKMTVEQIYTDGKLLSGNLLKSSDNKELFMALALNNDSEVNAFGASIGDPTEVALNIAAATAGFDKNKLEIDFPRVAEIPFDSSRKCMTTFHKREDGMGEGFVSYTKGALDILLESSTNIWSENKLQSLDRSELNAVADSMGADALRVLGIAMRSWEKLPDDFSPQNIECNLTLLGVAGMLDPQRDGAFEAVRLCKSAGIKPVMITGDHPLTAVTIAGRLGILNNLENEVITGRELEKLSLEEFESRVEDICVYARVAPEQKLKIVKALQDRGQFVAMTGDGINDAPALKQADIGVAMGITGTDVAQESADMILLDDDFATIIKAVNQGRQIYDNIRKFIKYTMTSNSGEIWTLFLAPFLGLPIPLLPIHILWINLVTDGLPGLALAAEPPEKNIMLRPPRDPKESVFAGGLATHIVWVGLLMGGVSILTQAWSIHVGDNHWQTMVFTVLCLSQMGHVLAIRSESESLFSQGIFSNKPLAWAFILTFVLQMATIYLPQLNKIFKTVPLTPIELLATLGMSSVVFIAVEIEKMVKRKKTSN